MRDFVAGAIWFDVALLLGFVTHVLTSERKERKVTMRLVAPQRPQRDRIQASELHEMDRKIAVARLKDELAPKVRWWKLKRTVARLLGR